MSQTLTIELPENVYAAVQRAADQAGTTPVDLLVKRLTEEFEQEDVDPRTPEELEQARQTFRSFCGIFNSGDPHGSDNERIDADLAREYADNHEP